MKKKRNYQTINKTDTTEACIQSIYIQGGH